MTNLVLCIGRLFLDEEALFNMFTINRDVKELIVEFEDQPRCYSQNLDYKRKYHINKSVNQNYREYSIRNNYQIKFCNPTKNASGQYQMKRYEPKIFPDRFKNLGIKSTPSCNNCEFVNLKDELCFQIVMSTAKNIFSVVYDKTIFTPEDVVDICGQIITRTDI